jgi:hypothetical protein
VPDPAPRRALTGRRVGPGDAWHLVRRFVAALRSSPPSAADEAWALAWLSDDDRLLWAAQSARDRRHTIAVARLVLDGAGPGAEGAGGNVELGEWVVPAALLHDVGKAEAPLGVTGRVVATVVEIVGGDRAVRRLVERSGRLGAIARYLDYPARGAATLDAAGAHRHVSAWAREHHLPPDRRTVPEPWASRLAAADDAAV